MKTCVWVCAIAFWSGSVFATNVLLISKKLEERGYPQAVKARGVANVDKASSMDVRLISKHRVRKSKYTIQVAAYQKKPEAIMKMSELQSHGYDAFYTEAQVKGQKWYRVNVGRFQAHYQAWNFQKKNRSKDKILQKSFLRAL